MKDAAQGQASLHKLRGQPLKRAGTLPALRFFSEQVLPLVNAKRGDDRFALTRIVKTYSPLLTQTALREANNTQEHLKQVNCAIDTLLALWTTGLDPTLLQVLRCVAEHNLLEIPDSLHANAFGAIEKAAPGSADEDAHENRETERAHAIEESLSSRFSQV